MPKLKPIPRSSRSNNTTPSLIATHTCPRCKGLLVHDSYMEIDSALRNRPPAVLRCVACGNLIDPVILSNRALQYASTTVTPMNGKQRASQKR